MLSSFVAILLSYLAGAIPTGVWVCKAKHKTDIRTMGSGNSGLTNVYRVYGIATALPVALVDLGKGMLAVYIGQKFSVFGLSTLHSGMLCGLIAVLGHSYTCFAAWRGGKGVLTAVGVYLLLSPIVALSCFITWALVVWRTGYVSLASIVGAALLPIGLLYQLFRGNGDGVLVFSGLLLGSFVIWRHRANITRLKNGTENRFGKKMEKANPLNRNSGEA